jgi:hypothetical protein
MKSLLIKQTSLIEILLSLNDKLMQMTIVSYIYFFLNANLSIQIYNKFKSWPQLVGKWQSMASTPNSKK